MHEKSFALSLALYSALQIVACNKQADETPPMPSAAAAAEAPAPAAATPSATVAEPLAAPAPSEAASGMAAGGEDRRHKFEGHERKGGHEHKAGE